MGNNKSNPYEGGYNKKGKWGHILSELEGDITWDTLISGCVEEPGDKEVEENQLTHGEG